MYIHIQLYRDINKIVYTYLNNTIIHTYNQTIFYTYSLTIILNTHKHSIDRIIICLLDDIVIKLFCIIFIYTSRTLIYICIYYCMYATIWICGRQYTLSAASRLAPLSRSIFATSTWPLQADQMRAVQSSYQRQTHTVRERHLAMDDTTHHSQTHMQRNIAYMGTQTCNSGLYCAFRFNNALYNATLALTQKLAPLYIFLHT